MRIEFGHKILLRHRDSSDPALEVLASDFIIENRHFPSKLLYNVPNVKAYRVVPALIGDMWECKRT